MAILEGLAAGVPVLCSPHGGNPELVKNQRNGYILTDRSAFWVRMKDLYSNKKALNELKQRTIIDFDERLHVRHSACKYMQLFQELINAEHKA